MSIFTEQRRESRQHSDERKRVSEQDANRTDLSDQHPKVVAQRALEQTQNRSSSVLSLMQTQQMLNSGPRAIAQAKLAESFQGHNSLLQSQSPVQRQSALEDEELSSSEPQAQAAQQVTMASAESPDDEEETPLQGKHGTLQLAREPAVIQANGLLETTQGVASGLLFGTETGDIGADVIVKLIRSQFSTPEIGTLVQRGLALIDQQYIIPKAGGWFWSRTPDIIKSVIPLGANFISGLAMLRTAFHVLPESLQTIILYFIANRFRKLLSLLESYISSERIDAVIEYVFVGNPVQSLENVYAWITGLISSPLSFLYNYVTGSGTTPVETQPPSTATTTGAPLGVGLAPNVTDGAEPGQQLEQRAQSTLDTLFAMNLDVIKLDVGQPKLKKKRTQTLTPPPLGNGPGAQVGTETPSVTDRTTEPQSSLDETTLKGGLSFPFNFSVNLFGREFRADQTNELILPWNGGLLLNVPRAVLTVNAGIDGLFNLRSIIVEPLVITERGLESLGLGVEGLNIAGGVVDVQQLIGRWSRGKGALVRGDVAVKAFDHTFLGRLILQLGPTGDFSFASVVIMSPDNFAIVPDVLTLTSPKFSGSVKKAEGINLAFSGNLALEAGIATLKTEQLVVAYDKRFGAEGGFGVKADSISLNVGGLGLTIHSPEYRSKEQALHAKLATLSFGKASEEPKPESDWLKDQTSNNQFDWLDLLKVSPSIEWAIEDICIQKTAPHFKMGKQKVAVISLKAFGLEAGLNFKERSGTLKGALGYNTKIPVINLPIPIVPGLEAFVDLNVMAGINGVVDGSLTKGAEDETPWSVKGDAGISGYVGAELSAGVQIGSQLLAALAVGLYARGRGLFDASAGLEGGIQLIESRLMPVEDDPMKAKYLISAAIIADVGLVVRAKVLYVKQKTLYQRQFKQWNMGEYKIEGAADWTNEGWKPVKADGAFEGGKPTEPAADDEPVNNAVEARRVLLEAGQTIAGGAELRRELVEQVIEEYKAKDELVHDQIQAAAQTLADFTSERFELQSEFLSSIRHGKKLTELKKKIESSRALVETLRGQYIEIMTVLVNVERAIQSVSDNSLELGSVNLTDYLQQIYAKEAELEDAQRRSQQVEADARNISEESRELGPTTSS